MRIHVLPDRRIFGGIAIGVLVGVLGVGAVTAASPSPAAPSGASGTAGGPAAGAGVKAGIAAGIKLGRLRQAIGRNFRVNVEATGKNGTHDFLYVRGTLNVSSSSLTVTLPDNSTQAFTVDSSTVVREAGKTVEYSMLNDGERAMVFGVKNGDGSYTAKLIRCVKDAQAAPGASTTP